MKKEIDIYAKNGIRLFPVETNGKKPTQGFEWKEDAIDDAEAINKIVDKFPDINLGAVIDHGFVVIDIDAKGEAHKYDGEATFKGLIKEYGLTPKTLTVKTPSGGLHLYFRSTNTNISASSANINGLMGIDIKSNGGGYVVAAGSSIDGNYYEIVDYDAPIADLPEWLEKLIEKPVLEPKPKPKQLPRSTAMNHSTGASDIEKQIQEALERLDASNFDGDYDGWLRVGMAIHSELPDTTGKSLWDSWSQGGSSYSKSAIDSSWLSFKAGGDITIGTLFYMAGYSPSRIKKSSSGIVFIPEMEMNDIGLVRQILIRYGQYIKYVSEHSDWMIWDVQDAVWLKGSDATKVLGHWQEEIVEGLVIDTESLSSDDKKLADYQNAWLRNQLNQNKINSVRQCLSERCAVSITQLDQNRRLIGVKNGVIELGRDGVILFRNQTPDDLVTKSMNVSYDVSAACPIFEKFLNTVMQGDVDMINYFQVWLGYCLTGEINESIINFLYGSGKNGKSVFTDTIISLFGDYAIKINSETFMKNKMGVTNSAAMSDLAQMHGARLVISDEVPTDASFNTKVIKSIVGESTVTAKFLYQNTFNYQSTAKILLYGNDKVYGDHADDGFWRRMKLIEFGYIVPDKEVNKNLLSDLRNEFAGILNWALAGYTEWALNPDGLVIPDVIEKASNDYRRELDSIAQYLDYKIESKGLIFNSGDQSHVVQADMMADYKEFCAEQSLILTTNPKKFKRVVERYFKDDSRVTISRVARGVAYSGILENKGFKSTQVVDMKTFLAS